MSIEAEFLSIDQVASLLRCDKNSVAERLTSGDLPGLKFGRGWVVPAAALIARVNELAVAAAADRRRSLSPAAEAPAQKKRGHPRFRLQD